MTVQHAKLHSSWFPFNYVMAIIDSDMDANAAVADFRTSGFHAEDVQNLSGPASKELDVECENCNIVHRMIRFLWRYVTTEGLEYARYEEEGKAGHHILAIHLQQPDQVEKARAILVAHNAHEFDRRGTMTTLPER